MKYFLAKSEPGVYSIDDLQRDGKTLWDGVKNAQAVRAIRSMRRGDRVFIYHSGGVSSIVGLADVISDPVDDPKEPKSAVVEVRFAGRIDPSISLKQIKESHLFDDWSLVRQSRLSTMAVPDSFVEWMREQCPQAKI